MDVFYAYTYGTAGWLALQAVPLIASPTLIVTMLSPDVREPSALETYFARSLGLALVALGVLNIILTGSVPLNSRLTEQIDGAPPDASEAKAPYALPALTMTMFYHAAAAFYSYTCWMSTGVISFAFGTIFGSVFASVGLWCMLFGSSNGRISKRTGADKRMSGWPFKNAEADKKRAGKKRL